MRAGAPQPSIGRGGKAAVVTLGCRLNQADSALVQGRLEGVGYEIVPPDSPEADVVVVNTCTVTATAARKSRAAAKRARERCPGALVVACGCDCERAPDFWRMESPADEALPNAGKRFVADIASGGGAPEGVWNSSEGREIGRASCRERV